MNQELSMSPNLLVAALQKPASEFTKADIVSYIKENDIRMVNFMYPAADGRLKTLNFVINNEAYLDAILTCGERVDGSSLFPFIEAGSSDLYVVPRFRTAFIDPFSEIEFLPVRAEEAADQLVIAKWVIRNLASQYGYNITFAPKITAGKAGSGLHIHMRIMKDGQNQMLKDGALSETARKAIAGMMKLASSITAFGNTNPTSYFRLVPHQEAPTNICWGDRNRSVLVRVPLGWSAKTDMCMLANPLETPSHYDTTQKQTVEMRSPDGSADLYQLIAGLAVACRYGFEIDDALGIAEKTYVNVNIHKKENEDKLKQLEQLPDSCAASADCLERQRAVFEQYHVFSPAMVDGVISKLRSYEDRTLRAEIQDSPEEMLKLVEKYFHCG